MTSKPAFCLSRGTVDDIVDITNLMFDSFQRAETATFMGCPDRTNLPKFGQRCIKKMETDKSDIWMLVRTKDTGKLIACSNWKVYVNGKPDDIGDEPIEWLEGEAREASENLARTINHNRWKRMKEPFIHLHICCTHPEYRRMGAGALMMQWGVDLMDFLFVPGWIEASPDGNLLYKTFGFHEVERVTVNGFPGVNMKRDVRTQGIEGGKAK